MNSALEKFLQRPQRYLNFYQYPPPVPLSDANFVARCALLDLDSDASLLGPFTIFISIPYCRVRCHSCPFFKEFLPAKSPGTTSVDDYVAALEQQMDILSAKHRFRNRKCAAVYLGGGTASVMTPVQVRRLIATIHRNFDTEENVEITLEGSPQDFTPEYLKAAHLAGVNRISLGYQSADQNTLSTTLNSPHNATEGQVAVRAAIDEGFRSVNVDLLYRLPGQTLEGWQRDVAIVLERFRPTCITMFEYVIHKGSASEKLIGRHVLPQPVDADLSYEWCAWARDALVEAGYQQHRKGSFALPGHEQLYGAYSYDRGSEILNIGSGAYGYINHRLILTSCSAAEYVRRISAGDYVPSDAMSVPASGAHGEERFVISNLLSSRVDRAMFASQFGRDMLVAFPEPIALLVSAGLATLTDASLLLTELGVKWRQRVLALFYDEDLLP